ncbi:S-adenosyl-L-methionine-dependent methyltransferase [Trichophaea hybrida]|nr:S-adenosyl-L-methionine-dependent methyltransferase [Trichophaea hybrida]
MSAEPTTAIEVDPAVLENSDSDYDSIGYATTTESLSSSVNEHIFENGRRYHVYFGPNKNLMPTDEKEQDRLDLNHEILLQLMKGEIILAPLKDPQRILDCGTGTGIWAIDAADKYPSAEVIGTDLSPIQPSWVPPNCKFEVDDIMQTWTFQDNSFDYVHSRNLAQCIEDWDKYMSQIYRVTKPGGYCELGESGGILYSDDNTMHLGIKLHYDLCREAMETIGRSFPTSSQLRTYLENAGFVDIQIKDFKMPHGPWAKDPLMKKVGAMLMLMGETGFEAYGLAAFTRILGMSKEDATEVFTNGLRGIRNKNFHTYTFFHVVYGRKPTVQE